MANQHTKLGNASGNLLHSLITTIENVPTNTIIAFLNAFSAQMISTEKVLESIQIAPAQFVYAIYSVQSTLS